MRWLQAALAAAGLLATAQAPAPTAGPPTLCPVVVRSAVAVPNDPNVVIFALEGVDSEGAASGTIAAFTAANKRYDLRFESVRIAPKTIASATYVFPHNVEITGAYVAGVDGYDAAACPITDPWFVLPGARISESFRRQLIERAAGRSPIAAPEPVDVAPLTCAQPYRTAHTVRAADPRDSPLPEAGFVYVLVTILRAGPPIDAVIARSDVPDLNSIALRSARTSTFEPTTFRCQSTVSRYIFIVQFAVK